MDFSMWLISKLYQLNSSVLYWKDKFPECHKMTWKWSQSHCIPGYVHFLSHNTNPNNNYAQLNFWVLRSQYEVGENYIYKCRPSSTALDWMTPFILFETSLCGEICQIKFKPMASPLSPTIKPFVHKRRALASLLSNKLLGKRSIYFLSVSFGYCSTLYPGVCHLI